MHYAKGSKGFRNGSGPAFVMKHKENSNTSKPNMVWYVESGASNHMTSHEVWLSHLEKPEQPRVIETGEDTPYTIEHAGDVPLNHVVQKGKFMNVLHVPEITKNLVSVRQIIDRGMQVQFTHLECFIIEDEGKVIAQARREGRMFILETNDVENAMFAKEKKVKLNIDLWHKWFAHVKFPRLQEMQMKNIVFGLPNFSY